MKSKNLILTIIAAIAAAAFLPLTAYASREGENMLYIEIYDLPEGSAVDILVRSKDIDIESICELNHSCKEIHSYCQDGYKAYFAHTDNEYVLSYYNDSPKGSYTKVKYDFGKQPPVRYKVIVCTAGGEVYVSRPQWFRHGRHMVGYYNDGAFTMKKWIEYSADSLSGVVLIMLIMHGLNTLRLLVVVAIDIGLAYIFKIKQYKALLIVDFAFVCFAAVSNFLAFINGWESFIVPVAFAAIKCAIFLKLYKDYYGWIKIALYSASTVALGYYAAFYLIKL